MQNFRSIPYSFLLVFLLFYSEATFSDLLIYHLDVNMGDATLVVDTKSGRSLLVDAGNRSYGRDVVAPTLKSLGINKLNYIVATHYDADHIGGIDELFDAGIRAEIVYDRGDFTHRTTTTSKGRVTQYGEYLSSIGTHRKTLIPQCLVINSVTKADIFLGVDTRIEVVAAGGVALRNDCTTNTKISRDKITNNKKDNDLSIAMVIHHKGFSYFIGGDLTGGGNGKTDMESLITSRVGDIDVLKLSHHGSSTSSNMSFLKTLMPEVVTISVGDGGVNRRYKLPTQNVLDRLTTLHTVPDVYLTHRGEGGEVDKQTVVNGNIIIYTNGSGYTVNGVVYQTDETE